MNFSHLVERISAFDAAARLAAGRTLQQVLCLRNWLIGASLVEFEQAGEERATYGERLLQQLADSLAAAGGQGLSARNLRNFRQVALAYPRLDGASLALRLAFFPGPGIRQTSAESPLPSFPSLVARFREQPGLAWRDEEWHARLFMSLTFSHLLELSRVDDVGCRAFYELHCVGERWSVRELQRQRDSMLYERAGLSENHDEVLALARRGTVAESPATLLRDPYVFEFLGVDRRAIVTEGRLEQALIDHLQQFLLELGRDFCFVDRQFRITVGNRHHFLDLLFFHRGLRCLVAVDLKLGEFRPEHAGQLRFYLNYLAECVARPDENPPVGILLCAERDAEIVRFATAGEEGLFVTRYQLELPSEEQFRHWLHEERARIELDPGQQPTPEPRPPA